MGLILWFFFLHLYTLHSAFIHRIYGFFRGSLCVTVSSQKYAQFASLYAVRYQTNDTHDEREREREKVHDDDANDYMMTMMKTLPCVFHNTLERVLHTICVIHITPTQWVYTKRLCIIDWLHAKTKKKIWLVLFHFFFCVCICTFVLKLTRARAHTHLMFFASLRIYSLMRTFS